MLGKNNKFNSMTEEWKQYKECLGHFFSADRIDRHVLCYLAVLHTNYSAT